MRRSLYLLFFLSGLLVAVVLIRRMARAQQAQSVGAVAEGATVLRFTPRASAATTTPEQADSSIVTPPLPMPTGGVERDSVPARRLRMAEVRAEIAERIVHGVLFGMAHERGVSSGLVVASRWDLLEAILRVEGLRAEDDADSAEDEQRLDALLREADSRDAQARADALAREAERTIETRPRERHRRHGRAG